MPDFADILAFDQFKAACKRPQAIAFDGTRFWTNLRERHALLAFGLPG